MSFLAPFAFWIAAAVVPPLVILYFLKLRRRREPISSTFLWRRAVQELQVNAPFQRLRKNLLLLLQLLVLALGVFALARPIVESSLSDKSSVVILLDRSASMNTKEPDGDTRLDQAKEQAVRLVRTFNQTGSRWWSLFSGAESLRRVMVIAYSDRATVISPFTTNMTDVVDLIRKLEPTDGTSNLTEALELAEAYMQQTRIEQTSESAEQAPALVLISDGAVPAMKDIVLHSDEIELIPIGAVRDNVGITALRVQRNYEQPALLSVFCQVQNFGPDPITTDVSIYIDNRLETVRGIELGAARGEVSATSEPAAGGDQPQGPGATTALSFEFPLADSALLEARLSRVDPFMTDNSALVVVPAPRKLRVLLVSAKNRLLEAALQPLPLESLSYLTPEQYESAPEEKIAAGGHSLYDTVIFDKHDTSRLPEGSYLFIDCLPEIEGVKKTGDVGNFAMMWWDETHPVLRHVALEYVYAAKGIKFSLPDDAQKLIEGPQGPVLARLVREGRHYMILGFPIEASTWWNKLSFPVFLYNVTRFLGGAGMTEDVGLHPGDTLRIPFPASVSEGKVLRPDGKTDTVRVEAGVGRYGRTDRVGLYRAQDGVPDRDRYAVNLENAQESRIAPRTDLGFNPTVHVDVGETIKTATPEVWRWFVGAALAIALLEWIIYNRRVML